MVSELRQTTAEIEYPASDGQPMADNTKQFEWIVYIKKGLDLLFEANEQVFVAGDLLWYPVEGNNKIRQAPDVMVVLGRPKGHRSSYIQHREDGVVPQVVFEIISPGNTVIEMNRKFQFYERYGINEYYLYDPEQQVLGGFVRQGNYLEHIPDVQGWVSPALGIRFEQNEVGNLVLYRSTGEPFMTYEEIAALAAKAQERAEAAEARALRLAEKLRALGVDPEQL